MRISDWSSDVCSSDLLQRSFLNGASAWATVAAEVLANPVNPLGYLGMGPVAASALEVFAHATAPRGKPAFGIASVSSGGRDWMVDATTGRSNPFGDLNRFPPAGLPQYTPRILIDP